MYPHPHPRLRIPEDPGNSLVTLENPEELGSLNSLWVLL